MGMNMTVDEVVTLFRPTYVSIDNPKHKGIPTLGNEIVSGFKVEFDTDGIHMFIQIA